MVNIVQNEGIGEIILTSVQNEGLMKGFDHILLDKCRKFINVPVLVNGGLNTSEEFSLLKKYNISGVY